MAIKTQTALFTVGLATSLSVFVCAHAHAQDVSGSQQPATKSGYSQEVTLEGPNGVTSEIAEDDADNGAFFDFLEDTKPVRGWHNFKDRLNKRFGLQLNFSYQTLYQSADETLTGISEAAAARGQIQGSWTLLGRGTENPGRLTFRFENRQTVNQPIPPSQLAFQFGSLTNSGTGFSDFGTALTELAWRQALMDGRFRFVTGKISAISWYNTHALSSSMRGFQNTGLQSSLSKPAPGRALGFGIGIQPNPHFVAVAGIHDANGVTTGNPFDTIGEGEFFYSAEIRFLPGPPDRAKWDTVKFQIWHQDARVKTGTPASTGATFEASYLINDRWYPFILGGISDGKASLFKADLVAGLGVGIDTRNRAARDVLGVAVGWGKPSLSQLQEQITAEAFYRFQATKAIAFTPSVQYVRNPAANPIDDEVWLFGLRSRLTF